MSRYLTLTDAVKIVPVSQITVRRAIKAGHLVAFKVGGRLLIRPGDLETWVEAGRVKAGPMPRPKRETTTFIDTIRQDRQEAA